MSPPPADLTVVLVDDDAPLLRGLGRVLRSEGMSVDVYDSPFDALGAVTESPPDVLVTDQAMPEMTGVQLATAVRRHLGPERRPTILALTGSYDTLTAQDRRVFDEVLHKPCPSERLVDAIRRWYDDRRVVTQSSVQLRPLKQDCGDDSSRTG